jgi:hypothetical protein
MPCIPPEVTPMDVWQWLGRGWFFYDRDGTKVPATIEQIDRHDYAVRTVDGDEYAFSRDRCYPHWPDCGAVNLQGFAVIVERQQARQYRRTYNDRCLSLNIPRKWDVMKRHAYVVNLTPASAEVVESVFNPEYYSYDKALELLDTGWVSVALNQYLVIAGESNEQLIYYRGKLLARVNDGVLEPLDLKNPRNLRILKWFNGRVRYANNDIRCSA